MLHRLSCPRRSTDTGWIIVDSVVRPHEEPRARPELDRDETNVAKPRARPKLDRDERWALLLDILKSCEAQAPRERIVQHVEAHALRIFSKLSDDGADVARSAEK